MVREKSDRPVAERKALEHEMKGAGISSPDEWRDAIVNEEELGPLESGQNVPEINQFTQIFQYLSASTVDSSKLAAFSSAQDSLARLDLLREMNPLEAAHALKNHSLSRSGYEYLSARLDFYQKLIRGEATKRYKVQEYKDGECVDVWKERPIDPSNANPDTIRLGLLRDTLYASMIGTPELAVFSISSKQCRERKIPQTHFPLVKGFRSLIDTDDSGCTYPLLRNVYTRARKVVERKYRDGDLADELLEHKAVMLGARWLTKSMDYNNPNRGPQSPYVSTNSEAIAWARLGHGVQGRFRGIRRKIGYFGLLNIERFIGKSGDSRFDRERSKVRRQIKYLNETYDNAAVDKFILKLNQDEMLRTKKRRDKEAQRLRNVCREQIDRLVAKGLDRDERGLTATQLRSKLEADICAIHDRADARCKFLATRSRQRLWTELQERLQALDVECEKRKNLAQMALDLHFHFNHAKRTGRGEYELKPFGGIVDWINNAPFGTIRRVHRAINSGVSDQTAMMLAVAEISHGKERNVSRADLEPYGFLLNLIKAGHGRNVIKNFDQYSGLRPEDHVGIVGALIQSGQGVYVAQSMDKFPGLSEEEQKKVAFQLILAGHGDTVVDNLESFKGIGPEDHWAIVDSCIKLKTVDQVVRHYEKFTGIDSREDKDILLQCIQAGQPWHIPENLEKFKGIAAVDHPEIVDALCKAGVRAQVLTHFDKFNGILPHAQKDLLLSSIKGGDGREVIRFFTKFTGVAQSDHREIVIELIKAGYGIYLDNRRRGNNALNQFTGLEPGLRKVIANGDYASLPRVLEAGFTPDEISRFPILISPLFGAR